MACFSTSVAACRVVPVACLWTVAMLLLDDLPLFSCATAPASALADVTARSNEAAVSLAQVSGRRHVDVTSHLDHVPAAWNQLLNLDSTFDGGKVFRFPAFDRVDFVSAWQDEVCATDDLHTELVADIAAAFATWMITVFFWPRAVLKALEGVVKNV